MPIRLLNSNVPRGFSFAATHCGLKKSKLDLAILVSEAPASAAAMFTTNRVKAAPVVASQLNIRKSKHHMRAVIVNSGNANCCTGSAGLSATAATTRKVARELGGLDASQILVCST
jgi:glutamate N-acetyltransferase / amino-acid N-acetyltransferase